LVNILTIRREQSLAVHSLEHPVEVLIRNARAEFEQMLERQSKTYAAAVEEYRRRYEIDSPPGFKAWYEFVVASQWPIITNST
jgi:RNase P subunit RPR2